MDGFSEMVRKRAERDPEFYALRYEQALSYLARGQAEYTSVALSILRQQLGVDDDEVQRIFGEESRSTSKNPILNVANRTIFIRDNLEVMRGINSASVDLIYLDPPFNSKRMFEAPIGSQAAGASFKDAWTLDDVKEEWVIQIEDEHPALAHIITAAGKAHSEGMQAYLTWMTVRLMEMHRLLKPTGSIYLHCDPTASHYLKATMDAVFGAENFRSEITWKRTTTHSDTKNWAAVNDIIFYYAHSSSYLWNPQYGEYDEKYVSTKYRYDDNDGRGRYTLDNMTSPNPRPNMMYEWRGHASPAKGWRYSRETMAQLDGEGRIWYPDSKERRPRLKRYLNEMPGRIQDTIWTDIAPVNSQAKERTGYPTQKPLALLERIIKASSNEGDVVLDPFCGCATACIAAERLGRQWIGVDISEKAYELVIDRMRKEVSLGDEEFPALFGSVIHRTDVPKRTDADAPRRSPGIKALLYGTQGGKCGGCQLELPVRLLEFDHITPRSKGGPDVDSNLQLLCGWCNRTKGARSNEYLRERIEQAA